MTWAITLQEKHETCPKKIPDDTGHGMCSGRGAAVTTAVEPGLGWKEQGEAAARSSNHNVYC